MNLVTCSRCGQKMRLGATSGPVKVKCPKCAQEMVIRPKSQAAGGTAAASQPVGQQTVGQQTAGQAKKPAAPSAKRPSGEAPKAAAKPTGRASTTAAKRPPAKQGGATQKTTPQTNAHSDNDPFSFDLPPAGQPTAAPPNFAAAPSPAKSAKKSKGLSGAMIGAIAGGGVVLLLLVGGIVFAVSGSGDSNGSGGAAGIGGVAAGGSNTGGNSSGGQSSGADPYALKTPGTPATYFETVGVSDSSHHAQAVDDFVALAGEFGTFMESNRDTDDETIRSGLKTFRDRFDAMKYRLVALPIMNSQAAIDLGNKLREDPPVQAEQVRQQAEAFRRVVASKPGAVKSVYNRTAASFVGAQDALRTVITVLPPPNYFAIDFDCRMWDSSRRILESILSSDSPDKVVRSIENETDLMRQMREVNHRWTQFGKPLEQKGSLFRPRRAVAENSVAQLLEGMPEPVQSAYADYQQARSEVQLERQPAHEVAANRSSRRPPEMTAQERALFDKSDAMMNQAMGANLASEIERTKKRFGDVKSVVIRLANPLEFFEASHLEIYLDQRLDVFGTEYLQGADGAVVVAGTSAPLDQVIRVLDFGTVTASDPAARTIDFTLDPNVDLEERLNPGF